MSLTNEDRNMEEDLLNSGGVPAADEAAESQTQPPVASAPTPSRPEGNKLPQWTPLVATALIAALVGGAIGYTRSNLWPGPRT